MFSGDGLFLHEKMQEANRVFREPFYTDAPFSRGVFFHLKGVNAMSQMMSYAMQLAQMLHGQTSPNPSVGCVIVKQGRIIGFGAHRFAGGPHAEVEALRMAGEAAHGADLYVTLEPCNHHGKTPPCTEAILQAGIKRVFVATEDKHVIVAGSGIKRLQDAGIEVEVG